MDMGRGVVWDDSRSLDSIIATYVFINGLLDRSGISAAHLFTFPFPWTHGDGTIVLPERLKREPRTEGLRSDP